MATSLLALLVIPGVFVLFGLWLWKVNRGITIVPPEALAMSPNRWDPAEIRRVAAEVKKVPLDTLPFLPPSTGRRYVLVGGSGLVGGWIIRHLIARGEDPKNIRIVDIRRPTRQDIHANQVDFISADVREPESLRTAFAAEWPEGSSTKKGITVFHTIALLRYYERHQSFIPRSSVVNVDGTANVLAAAKNAGADIFIYTSSASIPIQRTNFWVYPWQTHPKTMVQIINDATSCPSRHDEFISNYAYTKHLAEDLVRQAHDPENDFRTGCLRPGSPIYGPGGDLCAGAYLLRSVNPSHVYFSWVHPIIQSMIYVENVSYAHLLYESRLLETQSALPTSALHRLGGQAYSITDPGNPISYGDLYLALSTLTDDKVQFPKLPAGLMLVIATLVEAYYIFQARFPRYLPPITGDIVNLQPSLFDLASVHLKIDDARARLAPEDGGLGYRPPWTTVQGVCQLVNDHLKGAAHSEEYQKTNGGIGFKFPSRSAAKKESAV
ncbi:hypothetical protein NLJ89_g1638 [Agrocybe chaxingu]|uniref:3-beta hydroxysteroid dehydrogenase/isomerase domain-containing protein n=1 Tax=Agrocybe chaxingu TaxID=84603 RepID=A0A9W8MZN1_9AGAR|nr:hypothetical protein NLJ89_g1638 [Agrocybe chaxingu]